MTPVNADRTPRRNYMALAIMISVTGLIALDRVNLVPALRQVTNQLYAWGIVLSAVVILLGLLKGSTCKAGSHSCH